MAILTIIPARGGSKGVKKKNIRSVGSMSLVGRAVKCSLDSGIIEHVLVSTDDVSIRDEAIRYGAEVPFLRPADLSDDNASIEDTLFHAITCFEASMKITVSVVVLTEPTNPFRTPDKIREAVKLFQTGKYASVVSVCPVERVPQNIFEKKGDIITRFIKEPKVNINRRQDMKHLCRLSSEVYVFGRDEFLKKRQLILPPTGFVESTNIEAINIDEELDLEIADFIANKYGI